MRIFTWKSYGEIDVYQVDTIEQLEALNQLIYGVFKSLGLIAEYNTELENSPTNKTEQQYIRFIKDIVSEQVGSHESFEYGTGFSESVKKYLS